MKFMQSYLTPSQIGKVYMGGAIAGVFVVAVAVMEILEPETKVRTAPPTVENVITNRNSRQFGIDAVNDKVVGQNRQLKSLEQELENLKDKNKKLEKELEGSRYSSHENKALNRKIEQLAKTVSQLEAQQNEAVVQQEKNASTFQSVVGDNQGTSTVKHPDLKVNPERRKVASSSFSYGSGSPTQSRNVYANNNSSSGVANQNGSNLIIAPRVEEELIMIIEDEQAINQSVAKTEPTIYLPKGSILTGVLMTGLDAPTNASAVDSPIPVLVRIKKEAILPNYVVLNEVNECFAIMAGYGDLSSERAMIRGESITCVRHDKSVIEADFGGFAVGEDGKNGLKGTLVTRNSTILANSMMAGFAAGLSSMFDVNPVPVIATESTGQQQYQDVFNSSAINGGAAKGASQAMTKLSDYYMNLADSMHPIIEIGGGRVVDMVVTQGVDLTKGVNQ